MVGGGGTLFLSYSIRGLPLQSCRLSETATYIVWCPSITAGGGWLDFSYSAETSVQRQAPAGSGIFLYVVSQLPIVTSIFGASLYCVLKVLWLILPMSNLNNLCAIYTSLIYGAADTTRHFAGTLWRYVMSKLGPDTCCAFSLCQVHISIYKLSPSALQRHVGVVSSVCLIFAVLLLRQNTGESTLIGDQRSCKCSFRRVGSGEELCRVSPHQGRVFAFGHLVLLGVWVFCFCRDQRLKSCQTRMKCVAPNCKGLGKTINTRCVF